MNEPRHIIYYKTVDQIFTLLCFMMKNSDSLWLMLAITPLMCGTLGAGNINKVDLRNPPYANREWIGVLPETDATDSLAADLTALLRDNHKNAALLKLDSLLNDGIDATRTTRIIVLPTSPASACRAAMERKLVPYRASGGQIIWIGGSMPGRALSGLAEGAVATKKLEFNWRDLFNRATPRKELLLQADNWPARYFDPEPPTSANPDMPRGRTIFRRSATQEWEPLLRLVWSGATNVVGIAWPHGKPAMAYLPDYALMPSTWRDREGLSTRSRASSGSQYEMLDSAFAALLGDQLPDELFTPPPEFAGSDAAAEWRSPLLRKNGGCVGNKESWSVRRAEIRDTWHTLMGAWPSVISNQSLRVTSSERRENFMQHHVRFAWLPEEETDGYLLVPDGKGRRAAVITLFYQPETAIGIGGPYRDFALQLARRGFVALSLGTREASKRGEFALYWPTLEDAQAQPLSMLAYAAANACQALAKRPEVDPARIGVMGHSFGGKWAMFASCLYDGFACAVWSDPGIVFSEERASINYWEPWYLGYHPKPWRKRGMITEQNPGKGLYPELRKQGYDLTDLHALMAPRPFLVSGGAEDPPAQWRPLAHALEINRLLNAPKRVAMSNRLQHSPNAESNRLIYNFFAHYLR